MNVLCTIIDGTLPMRLPDLIVEWQGARIRTWGPLPWVTKFTVSDPLSHPAWATLQVFLLPSNFHRRKKKLWGHRLFCFDDYEPHRNYLSNNFSPFFFFFWLSAVPRSRLLAFTFDAQMRCWTGTLGGGGDRACGVGGGRGRTTPRRAHASSLNWI